jgi:hypothetical protein
VLPLLLLPPHDLMSAQVLVAGHSKAVLEWIAHLFTLVLLCLFSYLTALFCSFTPET